ncbi:conserved hypothetical protein [Methanothermus fervidus DSM 2088]|uniref:Uncharacterized protein n=1 Tax=Methanothermus fervidus (strain ATCC 43054 / DSM 2088 / JCM 10308 / V24 S) TaxID=523846 RepID=E3GZ65_METFV|nr:hypothetical protein [Methanothermus fervidus]ADP77597.1 conserved hypothetical protein [Methanothermus fervidus DSM 2088]
MRKTSIFFMVFMIFGIYLYIHGTLAPVKPVGRLGIVKLANPDMYPGHPQSKVAADYARRMGSKCVLVVHYAGASGYAHYKEGDITVINLAFIDNRGMRTNIDWQEVIQTFLFGIPENKYRYRADGYEFDTLDEAMNYVMEIAKENGQEGPIPMFYHGTVREGNPLINQGCGFPLYVQITWKYYGRFGAYYYVIKGMIEPYFNNPYAIYELMHASDLQKLYNEGYLNYE